jgi:histidinol-phosphate aminotransferase
MSLLRKSVESLNPYIPGEQPGAGVIKLNTNENPYPPSPRVAEALRTADPASLRLYPDPVSSGLRQRIADLHGCAPEQVFVGNGSDEVLALCVRAFVPEGGAVGYFEPSYSLYPVLAAIEEVPVKPVPLAEEFGWAMPSADPGSLFFLTNPNAPTSRLFPRVEVESFVRRSRGVVLIDEAYVDFAPASCIDLALSTPHVLVAHTLSKSYSLAGLRLGYAVGAASLIEALHKIKDSYNISLLTQRLADAALLDQAWMRTQVERIVATRERVARALRACGWLVLDSATNFLFVKPPSRPAREMFEALRARKIFVRYFPAPCTADYLRITIGTEADMETLLAALKGL